MGSNDSDPTTNLSTTDILDVTDRKIEKNRSKYPVEKSSGRLEKHNELD